MRKNFALLGATVVVCLVARPALAIDMDIGQSFQVAAQELSGNVDAGIAFKRAAMALETTDETAIQYTAALSQSPEASELKTTPTVTKNTEAKPIKKAAPVVARKKRARKKTRERLVAKINLSSQTMTIMVDGKSKHSWKISSGAKGHHTPTGSFKPYYMTSMHYSKKYNNAPMPHSVFFRGGYAVHATGSVRRLGSPASHGCIRLSPGNARKFFKLVQKHSKAGTRIRIAGSTPASRGFKKRYTRKKRKSRNNNNWANLQGYSNNYVSYNARRRSTSNRRIRIGRSRRASGGRILGWQF